MRDSQLEDLKSELFINIRARRDYWENLHPASGRPESSAYSKPNAWGVTAGDDLLKQQREATTQAEISNLASRS